MILKRVLGRLIDLFFDILGCYILVLLRLIEKLFDLNKEQWLNILIPMSLIGALFITAIREPLGEPIKGILYVIAWIFVGLMFLCLILLYWMDVQNVHSEQKKRG